MSASCNSGHSCGGGGNGGGVSWAGEAVVGFRRVDCQGH